MGTEFQISIDSEDYKNYEGVKINYSDLELDGFHIQNTALLFEDDIKQQSIDCFEVNGYKAFFKITGSGFPFDIFAAAFYLISRYEEYLPHTKDMYGRYAHENSIAFKNNFLHLPLINIWVDEFAEILRKKYPSFITHPPAFKIIPTYDIDIAYSYQHKGFVRNMGGIFRSVFAGKFSAAKERVRVLNNRSADPFDSYQQLDQLHQQYQLQPIYFFLVPEKNGLYDKNILPHKNAMWSLVKNHAKKYAIGLHPSWQSSDDLSLLKKEKEQLEAMAERPVTVSRQHYIRFSLPEGYHRLITNGITDDHSMGYGSINGFRASVASSFTWYDLQKETPTMLRIHPFCYMEANSFYEQRLTASQALNEMMEYYNLCKKFNGIYISIWHNHFLGTDPLYKGMGEVYEQFLAAIDRSLV